VAANLASLRFFLKREHGGPVYELHTHYSGKYRKEVHEMSDGLGYMLNDENQWQIILEDEHTRKKRTNR